MEAGTRCRWWAGGGVIATGLGLKVWKTIGKPQENGSGHPLLVVGRRNYYSHRPRAESVENHRKTTGKWKRAPARGGRPAELLQPPAQG